MRTTPERRFLSRRALWIYTLWLVSLHTRHSFSWRNNHPIQQRECTSVEELVISRRKLATYCVYYYISLRLCVTRWQVAFTNVWFSLASCHWTNRQFCNNFHWTLNMDEDSCGKNRWSRNDITEYFDDLSEICKDLSLIVSITSTWRRLTPTALATRMRIRCTVVQNLLLGRIK